MLPSSTMSEYNQKQWISFLAIQEACEKLTSSQLEELRESLESYLHFRRELDFYQERYFDPICRPSCFKTSLSACCGFESIITFFADEVITFLLSSQEQKRALFRVLQKPNHTGKCVYLGSNGCIWQVRPISCAMYLCEQVKKAVFEQYPEAQSLWTDFQQQEKEHNWPTKPVLFDDLEKYFIRLGVESPHLYFHNSPGLLRVKKQAGLIS